MPRAIESGDLRARSLCQAAEWLRGGRVSSVELTRACLDAIAGDHSRAFLYLDAKAALQQAEAADREIPAGNYRGSLHGIPVAIKDLIDVAGMPTTAASRVFASRIAAADAEVILRLRRAGAVLLGKTNLHEFAYGGSGLIGACGAVRNPRDPARIAGGSSSGSAAAVAANLCFAALGTDTAGSIRLPAAYCGVVGFKPTYGLVSTDGVVPLSQSHDHVGPMARNVPDAAAVFAAMVDHVPKADEARRPFRLAIARRYFCEGLDSAVANDFEEAVRRLEERFGRLREIELPIDEDRTVHRYEAWQYHREFVERAPDLYDPETLRRIRSGESVSPDAYDARKRELDALRRRAGEFFRDVDFVITPTTPIPPPTFAELAADPAGLRARELLMLRNTRPFNVLGVPAISLPLPGGAGLQLAAAPRHDAGVLQFAALVEDLVCLAANR